MSKSLLAPSRLISPESAAVAASPEAAAYTNCPGLRSQFWAEAGQLLAPESQREERIGQLLAKLIEHHSNGPTPVIAQEKALPDPNARFRGQ
jgi:hypothetical protein